MLKKKFNSKEYFSSFYWRELKKKFNFKHFKVQHFSKLQGIFGFFFIFTFDWTIFERIHGRDIYDLFFNLILSHFFNCVFFSNMILKR